MKCLFTGFIILLLSCIFILYILIFSFLSDVRMSFYLVKKASKDFFLMSIQLYWRKPCTKTASNSVSTALPSACWAQRIISSCRALFDNLFGQLCGGDGVIFWILLLAGKAVVADEAQDARSLLGVVCLLGVLKKRIRRPQKRGFSHRPSPCIQRSLLWQCQAGCPWRRSTSQ